MGVYLDHAASTPVRPEIASVIQRYLIDSGRMANPSSSHRDGIAARTALTQYREIVARHFDCRPGEIVFNSGGSEGDTHALIGGARMLERLRGRKLRIAISAVEHEAVVQSALRLVEDGHELIELPVDSHGYLPLEAVEHALSKAAPDLLSVMAVNNEIGTVQPVSEIVSLCTEREALFHCDAVRAVGHGLPEIERDPNIALLSCTGHKFGGPRGSGVLLVRHTTTTAVDLTGFPPLICGGGQEQGYRAGTENLAGIAGFAEALSLADAADTRRIEELRLHLEQRLRERWPACVIHGAAGENSNSRRRATGICSVAFPGRNGLELQRELDRRSISVGVGSACHSADGGAGSPTLRAMGVPQELAGATLRISTGWSNTEAEIEQAVEALGEIMP